MRRSRSRAAAGLLSAASASAVRRASRCPFADEVPGARSCPVGLSISLIAGRLAAGGHCAGYCRLGCLRIRGSSAATGSSASWTRARRGGAALIDAASRRALERNWVDEHGFTMPNRRKYPWQWLWDSCFHAIAWSALGDERCGTEMESLFALQQPSGFLPHMGYQSDPQRSMSLWQTAGRSDITQPPMYGHALRVLAQRGFAVEHLHARATDALGWLFRERRDPDSGLIRVVHPWESGRDDSPRWDGWEPRRFSERRWNRHKRELVKSLELSDGAATSNPQFEVAPAGFNALGGVQRARARGADRRCAAARAGRRAERGARRLLGRGAENVGRRPHSGTRDGRPRTHAGRTAGGARQRRRPSRLEDVCRAVRDQALLESVRPVGHRR